MSDIENITENIGVLIRIRRKRLGMTQLDVAEISGVQRQTIGRVESGSDAVTVAILARIAAAVGLDLVVKPRYDHGRS